MPGYELMGPEELQEIRSIFEHGGVLFRHGFDALRQNVFKVREFEQAMARRMGVAHTLGVSSGTAALRVALAALDIKPGDEVITQAFTFVATVEAIVEAGAVPIIAEIDATLNLDPLDLDRKITPRTRAIIAVHMLGTPASMEGVMAVAHARGLPVIEDAAWGCGGSLKGKMLGTMADLGTFSFDYAKTMTTGEGGMVLTNNPVYHARAAAYHDHGHENNPALPRWEDSRSGSGFNYRMNELQGAVGLAQLAKLDRVVEGQRRSRDALASIVSRLPGTQMRPEPPGSEGTADALVFYTRDQAAALACRRELLAEGLGTKILPEAITWHFAGTWTHIPTLVKGNGGTLDGAFSRSRSWLDRAVALPILVKLAERTEEKLARALERALT